MALYGPRNIVKNSLDVEFLMPSDETADAVVVEYINPRTWKPDEVTVTLPGSPEERPARLKLFGSADKAHAQREGLYMAASNFYRRTLVTFRTEMEGLIASYGDLIAIAHDMPEWGQGSEVVAWDAATRTLQVSEELTWADGKSHFIALRKKDGSLAGPYAVTQGPDRKSVVFATAPDFTPHIGADYERTHFQFGPGNKWAARAKIRSITPRRAGQVEIVAVLEDDRVHSVMPS